MSGDDRAYVDQIKFDVSTDYGFQRALEALTVAETRVQLADHKFMEEYKKLAQDNPNIKAAEVSKENPEIAEEIRLANEQSSKAESALRDRIATVANELGHDGSRKPYNNSETETARENESYKSALPKAQDELVNKAREAGGQEAKVVSRAIEDAKPEVENYTASVEAMQKNGTYSTLDKYKKEYEDSIDKSTDFHHPEKSTQGLKDFINSNHPEFGASKDFNNYIDDKLALESKVKAVIPDQYRNFSDSGLTDEGKRVVGEVEHGAEIDAKHNAKSSGTVTVNNTAQELPEGHPLKGVDPNTLQMALNSVTGSKLATDGKHYDQNTREQSATVGGQEQGGRSF